MGVELAPVTAMLDERHPCLSAQRDHNSYVLGRIFGHNVVVAVLPETGNNAAAVVATQLINDFPAVRFALLVGIGGGVPDLSNDIDIRLGDIVVSKPTSTFGGVVQYDMGKETVDGFERTGTLDKPPAVLRAAVQQLVARHEMEESQVDFYLSQMITEFPKMKEKYGHPDAGDDQLFETHYDHQGGKTCAGCDSAYVISRPARRNNTPQIHYGTIGSANQVLKNATERDKLKSGNLGIMCVEMEAAGLMDSFPCLVIRGICDYADSHKNKKWQPYAAAVASGYMKELLSIIPLQEVAPRSYTSAVVQNPREYCITETTGLHTCT